MSFARFLRRSVSKPEERRSSPRTRCRLHCSIQRGRKRFRARVVDVSEGGLCLLSPIPLVPKHTYRLSVDVPTLGAVEFDAVAWHVRPVKSGGAGGTKKIWSVGMMVLDTPEGFKALLPGGSLRSQPAAASPDSGTPGERCSPRREVVPRREEPRAGPLPTEDLLEEPQDADDAASADLLPFRVLVKALSGPRMRVLVLSAATLEEAEALARADLDDAWKVVEVGPA